MAEIIIRPVEDDDLAAVIALWHDCDLTKPYNPPDHDIAFCRASPTSELFVGIDDNHTLVASTMVGHDGHRGWLYYVAVDPTQRKLDLGRRMVAHGEDWLKSLGVRKVNLLIRETNTQVQAFYERIGYDVEPRTAMARWIGEKPTP